MGNPARELHGLLTRWREKMPKSNTSALGAVDVRTDPGAREALRAFALMGEIDLILRRLQANGNEVAVFQRQLLGWVRIPLMIGTGWSTGIAKAQAFPSEKLEQIESFALYLDTKVHVFSTSELASLGELIERARNQLLSDESLPAELVQYIHQLLQEIRLALDDDEVGISFDFAAATRRLWVALRAASGASTDDSKRQRWRSLADAIAVGTVSSGIIESGTAVIKLMLEG